MFLRIRVIDALWMLYKYVPHLVLLPLGLEVLGIDLELVVEVLGLQSAVD